MVTRWYIVDRTGNGSVEDPFRPKHSEQFAGYSGKYFNNFGKYVVRVYGEKADHNELSDRENISLINVNKAIQVFNNYDSQDWTASDLDNSFKINR
jgi:hypothetical protein